MGNRSHDIKKRIPVPVVSSFLSSQTQPDVVLDTTFNDEYLIVLPLIGIAQADSAKYIMGLQSKVHLFLELDGASVAVYHATTLLGWLGDSMEELKDKIANDNNIVCFLHSRGGSVNEPTATVAIRL